MKLFFALDSNGHWLCIALFVSLYPLIPSFYFERDCSTLMYRSIYSDNWVRIQGMSDDDILVPVVGDLHVYVEVVDSGFGNFMLGKTKLCVDVVGVIFEFI